MWFKFLIFLFFFLVFVSPGHPEPAGRIISPEVVVSRFPDALSDAERFQEMLRSSASSELTSAIAEFLNKHPASARKQPLAISDMRVRLFGHEFVPPDGIDEGLLKKIGAVAPDEEIVCIVQFNRVPSAEEIKSFLGTGAQPYFSVHNITIAGIPAKAVSTVRGLSCVRWLGEYDARYKVNTGVPPATTGKTGVYIWPLDVRTTRHQKDLNNLGILQFSYDPVARVYLVQCTPADVEKIAALSWVKWIEFEQVKQPKAVNFEPDDSREIVSAPDTWSSYTGQDVIVGLYDSGVWGSHPDFPSGALINSLVDSSGHGTHVAGIIASRGTRPLEGLYGARGVAPGSKLYLVYLNTETGSAFQTFVNAHAKVVNNSWGYSTYGYGSDAQIADAYVRNQKLGLVFAAGNDGEIGPSTVNDPATAKNVITVGALSYTAGSSSGGVGRRASYSSQGPTRYDGRLKPDLVAPGGDGPNDGVVSTNAQLFGTWLDSAQYRWPTDAYYTRKMGTSMACPFVTGIAALIHQAYGSYFTDDEGLVPRDIKALLVANAIPLKWYGGYPENGYANTVVGYGLADAFYSIFNGAGENQTLLWAHGAVVETSANSQDWAFTVNGTEKRLEIVMVYNDVEGSASSSQVLLDDVDVQVTAPDSTVFSSILAPGVTSKDTVRKIVIANPGAHGTGTWTATVWGNVWHDPANPFESQRYSIIIQSYYEDPYQLSFGDVVLSETTITANPGGAISLVATVKNKNGFSLAGITGKISGTGAFGGDFNNDKFAGNLVGKNAYRNLVFNLTAPSTTGTYPLTFTAKGINVNLSDASAALTVLVVAPNNAPVLSSGQVAPASGYTTTTFTYTVNYNDADGDTPTVKQVYIDGTGYDMTAPGGGPNGTYTYSTTLGVGSHNYYFFFNDGHGGTARLPSSGTSSGPTVTLPPNNAPVLSSGQVAPTSGDTTTTFTYTVNYNDADGDTPTVKQVVIDDVPYTMNAPGGGPNGTYTFSTGLGSGGHTYYFYFEDGHNGVARLPAAGAYIGPTVTGTAQVSLLSPNGGENLVGKSQYSIRWSTSGITGNYHIRLMYSVDGGNSYPYEIADDISDTSTYLWTVPDIVTPRARVKVVAEDATHNPVAQDGSDGDFSIAIATVRISGSVALTSGQGLSSVTMNYGDPQALDQAEQDYDAEFMFDAITRPWQEFQPSSEKLSRIDFLVRRVGSPGNIIVTLQTQDGLPIARGIVQQSAVPAGTNWIPVQLVPPLLVPDTVYRIVLEASITSPDPANRFYWEGKQFSSYDRGSSSGDLLLPGFDFAFRTYSGDPGPAATDTSGYYSITVVSGWSGTVTPNKTGYVFVPSFRTYESLGADRSGQNYTASANQPPDVPVNVFPQANATGVSLTTTLEASNYNDFEGEPQVASRWQIRIDGGSFDAAVWDYTTGPVTQVQVPAGVLDYDVKYWWRVSYADANGWSSPSIETAFTTLSAPAPSGGGGGGCFIATAAFGSGMGKQVEILKTFRDTVLEITGSGRMFVRWYYHNSPCAAHFINGHSKVRKAVRAILYPAAAAVHIATNVGRFIIFVVFLFAAAKILRKKLLEKQDILWKEKILSRK